MAVEAQTTIWVNGRPVEIPSSVFEDHPEPRTLVRFSGPIREEWKEALRDSGIRIEFWCPPFGACLLLPSSMVPSQLGARFPFLAGGTGYRQEHCARSETAAAQHPAAALTEGILDVVCFGREMRPAVEQRLRELGVTILASSGSKIRIRYAGDPAALRDLPGVKLAGPARMPVLVNAAVLARSLSAVDAGGAWQPGWDGAGETVAVADTGLDAGVDGPSMHADFRGRVKAVFSWPVNPSWDEYVKRPRSDDGPADESSGHGTHVAGLAVGSGSASRGLWRGVAPAAELVFQAIEQRMDIKPKLQAAVRSGHYLSGRPLDLRELFRQAREQGARIHVNSWGDPARGAYTDDCYETDLFLRENPDALVLFAAGNDGADHDGDGVIDSSSLYAPASAKNVLAVGATEGPASGVGWRATWADLDRARSRFRNGEQRTASISGKPERMALFSSSGPTVDGRIKPDVCAPGSNVVAVRSQRTGARGWGLANPLPYYMYLGGTSMANGVAGGVAAVVRQQWRRQPHHAELSGAALKALLILGASPVLCRGSIPAPTRSCGFGRLGIADSLPEQPAGRVWLLDDPGLGLHTGEEKEFPLDLPEGFALRAVLAWYDVPGERLINDLDLSLISPAAAVTWGNSSGDSSTGPDRCNTVERIATVVPEAGRYVLKVTAFNVPESPQTFGLAVLLPAGAPDPFAALRHPQPKGGDMSNSQLNEQPQPTASPTGGLLGDLGSTPQPPAKVGSGGVPMAPSQAPAGGISLDFGADISQSMLDAAPVFGDVLSSIGNGVAVSQTGLDKSIVDTIKTLNDTKIDVITDVIEQLDDDGLPDVNQTDLVKNNLSVLNFFTPTVHEWKHVSVSMDLEIGALDNERGITFHKDQQSKRSGGAMFWGFLGWFDTESHSSQDYKARTQNESAWMQGQIRMDALLGPRRTTKFPVPATVTIGPQIYISQGETTQKEEEGAVTERSVDILITVRKKDGAPNPDVTLVLDAAGLLPSFKTDDGFNGATTNAEGKVYVTLTRALSAGFTRAFARTVTISLGQVRKPATVVL